MSAPMSLGQAITTINNSSAAGQVSGQASSSAQVESNLVSQLARRVPVDESALVRLSRDRWPSEKVANASSTFAPVGRSKLASRSDDQADDEEQLKLVRKVIIAPQVTSRQEDKREALIHTEKFNATSKTLHLISGQQQQQFKKHQPQLYLRRGQQLSPISAQDQQVAESLFSPSRVAILSAEFNQSSPKTFTSMESADLSSSPSSANRSLLLRPRFDLLDLELTSSTATLTWRFALHPVSAIDEEEQQQQQQLDEDQSRRAGEEDRKTRQELIGGRAGNQVNRVDRLDRLAKRDTIRVWPNSRRQSGEEPAEDDEDKMEPMSTGADAARGEERDLLRKRQEPSLGSTTLAPNSTAGELIRLAELPRGQLKLSRIQPLPASSVRRPPARGGQQVANETADPNESPTASPSLAATTTTTSSTTTTKIPKKRPAAGRRPVRPISGSLASGRRKSSSTASPKLAANSTSSSAQEESEDSKPRMSPARLVEISEPPMIRVSSISLNRISPVTQNENRSFQSTSTQSSSIPTSASASTPSPLASSSTTSLPSTTTSTTTPTRTTSSTSTTRRPTTTMQQRAGKSLAPTTSSPAEETSAQQEPAASMIAVPISVKPTIGDSSTPRTIAITSTETPPETSQSATNSSLPLERGSSSERDTVKVNSSQTSSNTSLSPAPTLAGKHKLIARNEAPKLEDTSKWLIRLRKFASNEVDIVRVIINNVNEISKQQEKGKRDAPLRYISFKNLEPASAYEICVESASLNQQIGDRFQILNANHFLKCHDTNDVEIAQMSAPKSQVESAPIISRMDMVQDSVKLEEAKQVEQAASSRQPGKGASKIKSVCREFFTLPSNVQQPKSLHFGQFGSQSAEEIANSTTTTTAANGSSILANNQQVANQRRPKSLVSGSLKSRLELLEINDLNELANSQQAQRFELIASRGSNLAPAESPPNERISPIGSDTNYASSQPTLIRPLINGPPSGGVNFAAAGLSWPILSIVGCMFVLIFILTLINVLLNSLSCSSSWSSSSAASRAALDSSANSPSSRRQRRRTSSTIGFVSGAGSGFATRAGQPHPLGSLYSEDQSDLASGNSQSRMVLAKAGKPTGEPFACRAGSAYFELAGDQGMIAHRSRHSNCDRLSLADRRTVSSDSNGEPEARAATGKRSSVSHFISGDARFPLGPSFEGDERHNADMVGLARKNYDNFINHIYNSNQSAGGSPAPQADATEPEVGLINGPNHRHRHVHHHHRHHRHHSQQKQQQRQGRSQAELSQLNSSALLDESRQLLAEGQSQVNHQADSGFGQQTLASNKCSANKQRIRFDKINPIYNMDSIYGASRKNYRHKSASNVSTFGQVTPNAAALSNNELAADLMLGHKLLDQEANENELESENEENCPLCQEASDFQSSGPARRRGKGRGTGKGDSEQQLTSFGNNSSSLSECDAENCDEAAYFTCCLDKQTQRFEKQQQHLGRVITKNGSLIPQPFINPAGPDGCNSLTCELSDANQLISTPPPPPPLLGADQEDSISITLEGSFGEQVEGAIKHQVADEHPLERKVFLFGEQTGQVNEEETPDSVKKGRDSKLDSKTLVSISAMANKCSAANDLNNSDGIIKKTDFNQRRSELASKLRLAGMTKQ